METPQPEASMARSGRRQLVMLPRDPETAWVYWEWPSDQEDGSEGRLTVFVGRDEQPDNEVESHRVDDRFGGRFVSFGPPGAVHRCRLRFDGVDEWSQPVESPRRQAGERTPAFVRVRRTDRGLRAEPTDHEHPVHGTFRAPRWSAPSSRLEPDDR